MRFALKKGVSEDEGNVSINKKRLFIGIGAACVLLVLAVIIFAFIKQGNADADYAGNIEVKRDACKLFSTEDAKKVLGKNAKPSPNNANAVSSKATVSTCSYSSGSSKPEDLIALTVLVRSSNPIQARQAFEVARPKDATDVKSLGDQANFSAETSQMNILKKENWTIIAATKGGNGKLPVDVFKQTGEIIVNRL